MLADDLAALLREHPGSSIVELSALISAAGARTDDRTIARTLYGAHGRFRADGNDPSRWRIVTDVPDDKRSTRPADFAVVEDLPAQAFELPLYKW